jgi:hypothetical protein
MKFRFIIKYQIALILLFCTVLMTACGESAKEKAEKERKIKQLMMTVANGVACISLETKPDSLDKTMLLAVGLLEDSTRMEAYIKQNEQGELAIRETFSSFLAREMSSNIGMRVTDIVLTPLDAMNNFKGKALLKSGEKITFQANPDKGWYPENSKDVLQTITKYQIIKGLPKGEELDSIGIAPEAVNTYRGKYKLKSGKEQWIFVGHTGEGFSWNLSEAFDLKKVTEQAQAKK